MYISKKFIALATAGTLLVSPLCDFFERLGGNKYLHPLFSPFVVIANAEGKGDGDVLSTGAPVTLENMGFTDKQRDFATKVNFDIDEYEQGIIATGATIIDGSIENINVDTVNYMANHMYAS